MKEAELAIRIQMPRTVQVKARKATRAGQKSISCPKLYI